MIHKDYLLKNGFIFKQVNKYTDEEEFVNDELKLFASQSKEGKITLIMGNNEGNWGNIDNKSDFDNILENIKVSKVK